MGLSHSQEPAFALVTQEQVALLAGQWFAACLLLSFLHPTSSSTPRGKAVTSDPHHFSIW